MDRRGKAICAENPASFSIISKEKENGYSAAILNYINQMLMEEEDMEKYFMTHDSFALQAAEKSFYEVIGDKHPSPSTHHCLHNTPIMETPDPIFSGNLSDYSISSGSSYCTTSTFNSNESQHSSIAPNPIHYNSSPMPTTFSIPQNFALHSNSTSITQSSINHVRDFTTTNREFLETSMSGFFYSKSVSKSGYGMQFEKGIMQGTKFLPKYSPFIIDMESTTFSPSLRKAPPMVINSESDEREHLNGDSKGRKNHKSGDEAELQEGRSNKQSAVSTDDSELSELFDKVLLGPGLGKGPNIIMQQKNDKSCRYGGRKSRARRQVNNEEVLDLRTLLMLCAQAISCDNHSTAKELLKQIKQHSSSAGDGTQRLAHCFGNALEARLAGTGTQIYSVLSSKRTSVAEMERAYQMYDSACPFDRLEIIFALNAICSVAEEAEILHIIDFGINFGFKWPALIQRLSKRAGGPPKLRITGIEYPQPGFRPQERVHETGRRLASYCKRFNVPFEYNAIVQKNWEAIKIDDLKIVKNELVAVNCMFRFENLLDETVVMDNPRDAVLNLIREANPSIFVHGIVNGCYDAPFFVTRFREALSHYSALFDILDTNVVPEDPMRLKFEKDFFGREVMNVIACEGCERVQRPETYKQWQIRNTKNGFKQLPLDHQVVNKLKDTLKNNGYHSDFMLQVDGNWVLHGWKGKILHASSCWVPTRA
ncbi:hypothetical protein RIF29_27803 [Crotalaria pallida]|uniref:Uncharacterized protein n=1 Tax=Crotalaria pallida TaxID=3830 RepID=A0AAN9I2P7_CROPI